MHFKVPISLCVVSNELWSIFYYKVLEVLEELLKQQQFISTMPSATLSQTSAAAQFLSLLNEALAEKSDPGTVLNIAFPRTPSVIRIAAPQRINALNVPSEALKSTSASIELQVPPLTGGYPAMAGVSLARLLWRIPVQCLLTLIASLFLERRIIMVCKSKETLSAAVHAASSLIYPFEWPHRFYLPIIPESMLDFLQAPFPYLVGLPAQLMDFKGLEMDEVTLIDLDLGTCTPEPGSPYDDAEHLPKKAKLEEALHLAVKALRSPTEFEGNTVIAEIMTSYVVCLFKKYRQFIHKKEPVSLASVNPRGCLSRRPFFRGKNNRGVGESRASSAPDSLSTDSEDEDESGIDGHGYFFDHAKFVASHRSKKDRAFLQLFRQSQMYEVFIRQRLEMEALGEYPKDDPFEYKISLIDEHAKRLRPGVAPLRVWSRRLSAVPASMKLTAFNDTKFKRSQTLRSGHTSLAQHDELTEGTPSPETRSKKRLALGRGRDKRFSKQQSIKNIVSEMAKESSRRAIGSQPGSFLHQSRASMASMDLDDIPQYDNHHSTLHYQSPSTPLIAMTTEDDEDESTQSVSSEERLRASSVHSREFYQPSPRSAEFNRSSPWNASPTQSIFDAWNAQASQSTKQSKSIELQPSSLQALKSLSIQDKGDESDQRMSVSLNDNEDVKKRQVDSFLESNLNGLSSPQSIRLGLPPKPQRGINLTDSFHRN